MERILQEGLAALGIEAPSGAISLLRDYAALLLTANNDVNLTAIRDESAAARLHFLDCAALLTLTDLTGKSVLDVGTGAGFPGVPLRVLCPGLRLTMIDSVGKKMQFVRASCEKLGLSDVTCIWGRVEEYPGLRESFDVVVSRAVARLDVLSELCLPQVKQGGLFIAMKGPDCRTEVTGAEPAIKKLGGGEPVIRPYTIPGTDVVHSAVIIEKNAPTPAGYPRRYAQIRKKPLA